MSIRRTRLSFERDFTQIPNRWLRDPRLSRRARGLLAELMTHSQGWEITLESLVDSGPEGRDAIRSAITELEEAGYLVRQRERGTDGRLAGINYLLVDPEEPMSEKPTMVQQSLDDPMLKKNSSSEDQLQEDQEKTLVHKREKRSRVSADFQPSPEALTWLKSKYPKARIDVSRETQRFIGHHMAKGSLFKDWQQAWRNWIDRAVEYSGGTVTPINRGGAPAPSWDVHASVPRDPAFIKEMEQTTWE